MDSIKCNNKGRNANSQALRHLSVAGLLVTLGIVFGDIGTSPLYVMKAIPGVNAAYDANYIVGGYRV